MEITVTPYSSRQRRQVIRFARNQSRTHYHLDWHPLSTWLKSNDYLAILAHDQQKQLVGALMFSPAIDGVAWLRLVALHDNAPTSLFHTMLTQVYMLCPDYHIQEIAVLESEHWLAHYVITGGFQLIDRVIHLRRPAGGDLPIPDLKIRRAMRRDLRTIELVDHAAFAPHWQMRIDDFQEANRHACWFTVAEIDDQIVGYQLSTRYADAIHLARLATLPEFQRRGVGRALVTSLIRKFPRHPITVNTQETNHASQYLYARLGFQNQRWETPVWNLELLDNYS